MTNLDRAKQFLSFDALTGLRQELAKREEKLLTVEKKEISEERAYELSSILAVLQKGDEIEVTFYFRGVYVCLQGIINKINLAYRFICLNDSKIAFDDIYDIKRIKI